MFFDAQKRYKETTKYIFLKQDYEKKLDLPNDFDLLISQYAGFVSEAGKGRLKKGGILIANNSHADAGIANLDPDFELIAVAKHTNDVWRISEKDLDGYFIPKSGKPDNKQMLLQSMKGTAYTKTASNYIFRKATGS